MNGAAVCKHCKHLESATDQLPAGHSKSVLGGQDCFWNINNLLGLANDEFKLTRNQLPFQNTATGLQWIFQQSSQQILLVSQQLLKFPTINLSVRLERQKQFVRRVLSVSRQQNGDISIFHGTKKTAGSLQCIFFSVTII